MFSDGPRRWRSITTVLIVAALGLPVPAARAQSVQDDFVVAVVNDRVQEIKRLLGSGADPDMLDSNGDPVLVIAVRAGNTATVDLLLATRANVDARTKFGDTALMMGALLGRLDIVKKLRARGASVNQQGWTPLMYAATGGHDDIVRYLLAEGAEMDASSPNGTTALMMAAREGKRSTVELLVARGADVNRRNQSGASALDWARRSKEPAMVERLQRAGAR
ncbi:MAG: ankyrin repeat domain-containing protein [Casimicrobiaceae bacterium]